MNPPCYCRHAMSAHHRGLACEHCGCDRYVPDADDTREPAEDPDAWQAGQRSYEKWLGRS